MAHHTKVFWERRPGEQFTDLKYSRTHRWSFDGGVEIPASSSPSIVPLPYSDASSVDPEEAFTAALSSCHMLSFLSVAAARKFVVERYEDNAEYSMAKNADGKTVVENVTLRPAIEFSGPSIPSAVQIAELHEMAHSECFLANSVKSKIIIIPRKSLEE